MTDFDVFRPHAVIFDLDGTLTDNMLWHTQAFDAFVERHGLPAITMDIRRRIDGRSNSHIFPILFGRDMTDEEIRAHEEEKEGAYRQLSRSSLRPLPGLHRLLDLLERNAVHVAVATSAPALNVAHTLSELGLIDRIPVIVRSDQVGKSKPAPDVYLSAASVLGVDPGMCLAFEDAPVGVASARAAGMRCIAITSTFSAEDLAGFDPAPDATYPDFEAYLAAEGTWLCE